MKDKKYLVDDEKWISDRKALWLANKDKYHNFLWNHCSRELLLAKERFFFYGELSTGRRGEHLVSDWDKILFNPKMGDDEFFSIVSTLDGPAAFLHRNPNYFNNYFATEYGFLNGYERELHRRLLPERFDFEMWCSQNDKNRVGLKLHLNPVDATCIMLSAGIEFLVRHHANPHDPIQDFVGYWLSTLPYIKYEDWVNVKDRYNKNVQGAVLLFLSSIRYFREPRNEDQSTSVAKIFKDKLFNALECGTDNEVIDALWQRTLKDSGVYPQRTAYNEMIPERVYVGTDNPRILSLVVDAWYKSGFSSMPFSLDQVRLINLRKHLSRHISRLLGGDELPTDDSNDQYACSSHVPALYYRVEINSSMSLIPDRQYLRCIHLYYLIAQANIDSTQSLPRLFCVPEYDPLCYSSEKYTFPTHEALCEREVVHALQAKGVCLARVDSSDVESEFVLPPERFGAEFHWRCYKGRFFASDARSIKLKPVTALSMRPDVNLPILLDTLGIDKS